MVTRANWYDVMRRPIPFGSDRSATGRSHLPNDLVPDSGRIRNLLDDMSTVFIQI